MFGEMIEVRVNNVPEPFCRMLSDQSKRSLVEERETFAAILSMSLTHLHQHRYLPQTGKWVVVFVTSI